MKSPEFRVVIPARYGATRFPGKPLAALQGRPIVQHVYERARESGASEVLVATDDPRIADAARSFGADVEMTRADHRSGTERIAEVASLRSWPGAAIVVNVQGDAPLIPPESIRQVARVLSLDDICGIATLRVPLLTRHDYLAQHVVKVVVDARERAIYFSRAPIPALAHGASGNAAVPAQAWRHIGLYAYRVNVLQQITAAPACELESVEALEQLRALWLGMEIRVALAEADHGPDVDVPSDLDAVRRFMSRNETLSP